MMMMMMMMMMVILVHTHNPFKVKVLASPKELSTYIRKIVLQSALFNASPITLILLHHHHHHHHPNQTNPKFSIPKCVQTKKTSTKTIPNPPTHSPNLGGGTKSKRSIRRGTSFQLTCTGVPWSSPSRFFGDGKNPTFNGNPYNGAL